MADTSGKQRSVGLRSVQIFELDTTGFPSGAVDATIYTGLDLEGGRVFNITNGSPRRIDHDDNDVVQQVDYLPPTEGSSGELRVGIDNQPVNAVLMGVEEYTVGEAQMLDWSTNQQGSEPDVALVMYQQALDTTTSLRRWRGFIADKTRCIPNPSSFGEKSETVYNIALSPSANHVWGTARTVAEEGNTKAAFATGMFEGKPRFGFALGDASTVAFTFSTDEQAISVDKVEVWVNGVLTSAGITVATTGVTFDAAPANGAKIAIKWEF